MKIHTVLVSTFISLLVVSCSLGEKFNSSEDHGKTIKILVIYTEEAAQNLIDINNPTSVDLDLAESRELLEADALYKVGVSNYTAENSAVTHRFELVDGDNSDIYKTYILNKTLEEIVSEAEPGQHGEPCQIKLQ